MTILFGSRNSARAVENNLSAITVRSHYRVSPRRLAGAVGEWNAPYLSRAPDHSIIYWEEQSTLGIYPTAHFAPYTSN
jgi:hypothetical protein